MITILKKEGSKLKNLSLEDIKTKKGLFVEVVEPTTKDIHDISKKFDIDEEDINDSIDEDARAHVEINDSYSIIIFRAAYEDDAIFTVPILFIIKDDNIILFRKQNMNAFARFNALTDEKKLELLSKGPFAILYRALDEILRHYFTMLDKTEDGIDKVEEDVLKDPKKKTVAEIFKIKKELIYIYKAMIANNEVISDIEKGYLFTLKKEETRLIRDIYYDARQIIDIAGTQRDILTGTLDVYLSSISNNLNTIMKKMTAMGSFILIPTLISGIYGMNFQHMPELYWKYGYWFALALMIVSVLGMYSYFSRKGWL